MGATAARSNAHIRALASLWFVLSGLAGFLLLVVLIQTKLAQDFPSAIRAIASLMLAFLFALGIAIGLRRRWLVARIVNILASIACVLGALWLINDTINLKRENPMLDMSWYLQNPLVWFPILLGVGLGIYGIWAMLTQWSPGARRDIETAPMLTNTEPVSHKPAPNLERSTSNLFMIWDLGLLLTLAYVFGLTLSGLRAMDDGCTTGCGLFVLPLTAVALLLALIELFRIFRYRLWQGTRLYWLLAAIGLAIVRGYLVAIRP